MFLYDHLAGSNDFASNFASVAEEKREQEERRQAEFILKLLEELEQRQEGSAPQTVERMVAIDENGYIRRSRDEGPRSREKYHNKVHTIKDLPYEPEWEQVFGKPPEPEPVIEVRSGRRVDDGEKVHMISNTQTRDAFYWTGMGPTGLMVATVVVFVLLLIAVQLLRRRPAQRATSMPKMVMLPAPVAFRQHLGKCNMTVNDFI